jgi:DNA-binding LytR/AlgR family response regulator
VDDLELRPQAREPPSLDALVEQLAGRLGAGKPAEHLRWIKASVGSNVRLIPVEEVLFFQSDEKYTRVVTCDSEALIRKPIKELLDELDPAKFWQIHRATIVNVDHIASVRRGLKDQAEIALKDHRETLVVSRAFTHLFKQM